MASDNDHGIGRTEAITLKDVPTKWGYLRVAWGETTGLMAIEGVKSLDMFTEIIRVIHTPTPAVVAVIPPDATVTPAKVEKLKTLVEEAKTARASEPAKAAPPPATEGVGRLVEAAKVEAPASTEEADYSAFSSMEQLKDVVKEVVKRGAKDFTAVKAAVQDIADSGMCPLLVRIGQNLDARLTSTCTALKLPGTAGAPT